MTCYSSQLIAETQMGGGGRMNILTARAVRGGWPYVMIGVYPQRLRFVKHDVPRRVAQNLSTALRHWQARLPALQANRFSRERTEATINYYSRELQGFLKIWPKALARSLKGEH